MSTNDTGSVDDGVADGSRSWRYLAWLQTWPLNHFTIMDYFRLSDFYDKSCNNEIIYMQKTVEHSQIKYGHTHIYTRIHTTHYTHIHTSSHNKATQRPTRSLIQIAIHIYILLKHHTPINTHTHTLTLTHTYTHPFPYGRTMRGIEYEVDTSSAQAKQNPSYFVIRKQYRESESNVNILAVYYIVGTGPQWGTVYQMPSVYSVLSCNLVCLSQPIVCIPVLLPKPTQTT